MIDYIFICKEAAVEGPNPQLVLYTCRQSIVVSDAVVRRRLEGYLILY